MASRILLIKSFEVVHCAGEKKKNPVITWDLFCTLPKCKTSQLAFLPMQNGCSSSSNYMGIEVLPPGLYFSINISSDIFQNSMYWFPRLFFQLTGQPW